MYPLRPLLVRKGRDPRGCLRRVPFLRWMAETRKQKVLLPPRRGFWYSSLVTGWMSAGSAYSVSEGKTVDIAR